MQEQLKTIVKRFKQVHIYNLISNKQNDSRFQANNKDISASKQQPSLSNGQKIAKDMFQSLISDGYRMHLCYEEMILQSTTQIETLKQELNVGRKQFDQERLETEKVITDLQGKIGLLNKQIASKQESIREITEKYEYHVQQSNEVHIEGSRLVKQLQDQRLRESMNFQEEIKTSFNQIRETKHLLSEAMQDNQRLLQQNYQLKNIVMRLNEKNQYLKEKLQSEKAKGLIRIQDLEEQQHLFGFMQEEDAQSVHRGSKFDVDQALKMNNSQDILLTEERQVLNISEHYSKINRTQEMHVRGKSTDFDLLETTSIIRKYPTNELNSKTSHFFQKQSLKRGNSLVIQQRIDFYDDKIQDMYKGQMIDPYRAFFQLLVQSQKLNSPYFSQVSMIDINYLFQQLINTYVPFNLWQVKIKNELESSILDNDL